MNIKISVIIPIYEGEKYIGKLLEKIKNQKIDYNVEIIFPVTKSKDNSLELCKKFGDIVYEIDKFNHGLTRHEAAEKANGNILVFMTQDAFPCNEEWLKELINPIVNSESHAVFSRQVPYLDATEMEKLMRNYNYPSISRVCSKETEKKYGRMNFFYSDVSSAVNKEIFFKVGGYNFEVPTAEDSLLAITLIKEGYKIKYNAESKVYHSHNFTLKQNYKRYKLIGQFEKMMNDKINKGSSEKEGIKLLKYLIINLLKKGKVIELFFKLPLDILIRYIGYKIGSKNE